MLRKKKKRNFACDLKFLNSEKKLRFQIIHLSNIFNNFFYYSNSEEFFSFSIKLVNILNDF